MSNAIETAKFLRRYQSWRKGEIDVFYPDSHAGPNPVEISAAIDRAIAALEAQPPCGADGAVTFALDYYDAGLLGDGGGGNVEWWQDYMRSELSRAHDCYQSQIDANHQPAAPVAPATVAVPETDAVCAAMDRQYLAGLQAGWGLGSLNDRDGYTAAQNARRNDLALLASQPAAPVARSLSESFDKVMAMQDPKDIPDDAITLESCDRARRLMTDLGYATDDSRDPLAQDFKTRLIAKHFMRAMEAAPVAPATVAVPIRRMMARLAELLDEDQFAEMERIALAAGVQPPLVPNDVVCALDRMCTPLHESFLKGATAKEDARCMKVIRDYILATHPQGVRAVPGEYVLVPVNPTREMISAGDAANDGIVSDIYRAMVSQVVKESFTTAVPRVPFSMPDAAVERIYDAARRSFRRFASSVRGQMVTKAGGYEWHVINATLDEVRSMLDASQREGGGT